MAAITTALIVGSAIAAGGAVAGAGIQAHAAGKAADTQAAAGDRALALQRDMYRQSRSDLAPYMSAGMGANSTLAELMGTGMPAVPQTDGSGPPLLSSVARGGISLVDRVRERGQPVPVGGGQTPDAARTQPAGGGTGYAGGERPAPASSGYVQMRAPDGSVAHVPEAAVDQAMQRGAVRM